MKRTNILETTTALLIFLFLYTALSKYLDFHTFKYFIAQAPFLKNQYNNTDYIAYPLPALEIVIVILLIIPKSRLVGLYSSCILLTLFTIYLVAMVLFIKKLPCGCGGVLNSLSWTQHIFFNLFFLGISIIGIKLQQSSISTVKNKDSKLIISNT